MKTILVTTDFSNNANYAVKYANEFAQLTNSKIILLHVVIPLVGKYNIIPGIVAENNAIENNNSQKKLEELSSKYLKAEHMAVVKFGDPVDEIIRTSKENKADIIIMGTRGATGLQKLLFGSNTVEVVSKSEIPVLAIPLGYKFKKINTIVYSTDLKNSINELMHIIPIAKKLKATIEIFNLHYSYNNNEEEYAAIEEKIKSLSYKKIILVKQNATLENTTIEQITKYLLKTKPQILVMFPENKSWFEKVFISSKTEELAYELKVPLLSIRKSMVQTP
jgi:nucleotide-binding universal stress UspA family protein